MTHRAFKIMTAAALVTLGMGTAAAPAMASSASPPGNNGTVKIDGQPLDNGHDNEPHPGCTFRITLFGFDAGRDTADVTFALQPPTGSTTLSRDRFSFTATRDHGGATYDGASPLYDLTPMLSGITASKQGYHVKVSVSVNGGNPKHKVLWVAPCAGSAPAAPSPAAVSPVSTASAANPTATATSVGAASAARLPTLRAASLESDAFRAPMAATPAPAAVLGEVVTRPASATNGVEASRPASLPFTGFDALRWSLLGLVLLAAGAVLVRHTRRRAGVS